MTKQHRGGLGDAPIEPKYYRNMNALARTLDERFNGDKKEGSRGGWRSILP